MMRTLATLLLSCLALGRPLCAQSATDFQRRARAQAKPLPAAGQPLVAFDELVGAARVIGVGESVHSVQQFMAFRIGLLEDLHPINTPIMIETTTQDGCWSEV